MIADIDDLHSKSTVNHCHNVKIFTMPSKPKRRAVSFYPVPMARYWSIKNEILSIIVSNSNVHAYLLKYLI